MNKIKTGKILIMIGFAVWIIENIWFGWNRLPMTEAEEICDNIVRVLMFLGVSIYSLPIWSLYESAVKKNDENLKQQ